MTATEYADQIISSGKSRVCSIEGCDKGGRLRRGWCHMHYTRWRRHGDPHFRFHADPPIVRLLDSIDPQLNGCWNWTDAFDVNGYGRFAHESERWVHRVAYLLLVGPIPKGLHIDHLCRNRPCVNPAHLEAVTQAENNRRSREAR